MYPRAPPFRMYNVRLPVSILSTVRLSLSHSFHRSLRSPTFPALRSTFTVSPTLSGGYFFRNFPRFSSAAWTFKALSGLCA